MASKVQERILTMLSDGLPHHKTELFNCLYDTFEPRENTLAKHICQMRKSLEAKGETIVCVFANRRTFYRHVRLLRDDD